MERRPTSILTTLAVSVLALTLIAPRGLGQDPDRIAEIRRRAEQGDVDAQFTLGAYRRRSCAGFSAKRRGIRGSADVYFHRARAKMEILVGSSPPRAVPDGSQFVPTDALPYPTCGGSLPVSRFHQLHIARHDKKGLDVTALEEQIEIARRQIVSDGYAMSVGELISLYKGKELIINPSYQRLFRWEESQKTRFIESLLLGIPIPQYLSFRRPTASGS